jgi:hypothetical protein
LPFTEKIAMDIAFQKKKQILIPSHVYGVMSVQTKVKKTSVYGRTALKGQSHEKVGEIRPC